MEKDFSWKKGSSLEKEVLRKSPPRCFKVSPEEKSLTNFKIIFMMCLIFYISV